MNANSSTEELDYDAPYNTTGHSYFIRTAFPDGEIIEDRDFAEHARWDWFDSVVQLSKAGDEMELIDGSTGEVLQAVNRHHKPLASSKDNTVLNAVRRTGVSYADALDLLADSKLMDPPKARRILPNSQRGKLLQQLLSIGPVRLVPDPHEHGWVFKGGFYRGEHDGRRAYLKGLEGYEKDATLILQRLTRLQRAQSGS